MKRRKITVELDESDYGAVLALADRHGLSRAEVVRRGVRFALRWKKLSFFGKIFRGFR